MRTDPVSRVASFSTTATHNYNCNIAPEKSHFNETLNRNMQTTKYYNYWVCSVTFAMQNN